jgi:hypothetical protein
VSSESVSSASFLSLKSLFPRGGLQLELLSPKRSFSLSFTRSVTAELMSISFETGFFCVHNYPLFFIGAMFFFDRRHVLEYENRSFVKSGLIVWLIRTLTDGSTHTSKLN